MAMVGNYLLQARSAKQRFLSYDQQKLIQKFRLEWDETFLYTTLLGRKYRICRQTGDMDCLTDGGWADGNSYEEVMTLLDLLCDSRDDRFIAGRWKSMESFGLMFHQNLLQDERDPLAERFDREPEALRKAGLAIGGKPQAGADIAFVFEVFDGLPIVLQFWHGDEEFAPRIRWLWDENARMYIRYETMYFAVGLLRRRILERM
jgi:hypothetical protein